MSEENTETEPSKLKSWPWYVAGLLTLLVIYFAYSYYKAGEVANLEANEFGDFLAGFSSTLAFIWLVAGYYQNNVAIQNQIKELKGSTSNLDRANNLQVQQIEVEEHKAMLDEIEMARSILLQHTCVMMRETFNTSMLLNEEGLANCLRSLTSHKDKISQFLANAGNNAIKEDDMPESLKKAIKGHCYLNDFRNSYNAISESIKIRVKGKMFSREWNTYFGYLGIYCDVYHQVENIARYAEKFIKKED